MRTYPIHVISGKGKGYLYSSYTQVGDLIPARPMGQAKVDIFANLANGNYVISDHNQHYVDQAGDVDLHYVYNHQLEKNTAHWRFAFRTISKFPTQTSPGKLIEEDGSEVEYTHQGNGIYTAPGWSEGTPYLQKSQQHWVWYHPKKGLTEIYNNQGQLVERRGLTGKKTKFSYDSNNELSSIMLSSGRTLTIKRAKVANGRVEEIYDGQQLLQTYEFDNLGRLLSSTVSGKYAVKPDYKTTYHYQGNNTQVDSISQDDGSYFKLSTQTIGQRQGINTPAYSRDNHGFRYDYNDAKHTVEISMPGNGIDAVIEYDNNWRIKKVTRKDIYKTLSNNADDPSVSYDYAISGQVATITHADQSQDTFEYTQGFGLLTKHTGQNGQVTQHFYANANNRPYIQSTCEIMPDGSQAIHSIINRVITNSATKAPEDQIIEPVYQVTPAGKVVKIATGKDHLPRHYCQFTENQYPSGVRSEKVAPTIADMQKWEQTSVKDKQAIQRMEQLHDSHGLPSQTIHYAKVDAQGNGVLNEQTGTQVSTWNAHGQKRSHSIVKEYHKKANVDSVQETHFDHLQRVDFITDPLRRDTEIDYAYQKSQTDDATTTKTITKPNGAKQIVTTNGAGFTISKTQNAENINGVIEQQTTSYELDACDQPSLVTHPDGTQTYVLNDRHNRPILNITEDGFVTYFFHNDCNNYIATTKFANPIDMTLFKKTKNIEFVLKNQLKRDAHNDRTSYVFKDSSNRVRYQIDADNFVIEYQYDCRDLKTNTIHYADALTQVELQVLTDKKSLQRKVDYSKDRVKTYYYDLDKKLTAQIDPDGWVTEYERDGADNIRHEIRYATPYPQSSRPSSFSQITIKPDPAHDAHTYHVYDGRGQVLCTVDAEGYISTFEYSAFGKVTTEKHYNEKVDKTWYQQTNTMPTIPSSSKPLVTKHYEYDLKFRETNVYIENGLGTKTQYDEMGNVTYVEKYDTRHENDPLSKSNPDQVRIHQAQYDGFNRAARKANPFISLEMEIIQADKKLDAHQKAAKIKALWDDHSLRTTYDTSGLMIKTTNTLGYEKIYFYNKKRQPVFVINAEGGVITTKYNAFNEVKEIRHHVNKIDQSALAHLSGGFVDSGILALIQQSTEDVIETFERDRRGNITKHINGEGYISEKETNAFGEVSIEKLPVDSKQPTLTIEHLFNPNGLETAVIRSTTTEIITERSRYENCHGKKTSHTNANGDVTKYSHDKVGNTTDIIDADDVTIHTFKHDGLGRVTDDTDALGASTHTGYDDSQHTVTVHHADNIAFDKVTKNVFTEVVQHENALQQTKNFKHAPNGKIAHMTDELGNESSRQFNSEGWKDESTNANGINTKYSRNKIGSLSDTTIDTADKKIKTSFSRDGVDRVYEKTNPRGVLQKKQYDKQNLVTTTTDDAAHSGLNITTKTQYNGLKHRTQMVKGDSKQPEVYRVAFEHDELGRSLGKIVDPKDSQHANALHLQEKNTLNKQGKVIKHTDPKGQAYYLFYNKQGKKRFKVTADGQVIEWRYDKMQLGSARINYRNRIDIKAINEKLSLTALTGLVTKIANEKLDEQFAYFRDENKNIRFTLKRNYDFRNKKYTASVIETRYDKARRKSQVIGYANSIDGANLASYTYQNLVQLMPHHVNHHSNGDRHTYYVRDAKGQLRFHFYPDNTVHESRYDAAGRIICEIKYAAHNINPLNYVNKTADNIHIPKSEDDQITWRVFERNFNKPRYVINPECGVEKYEHDENGNLVYECKFKDRITLAKNASYQSIVKQLEQLQPQQGIDSIKHYGFDNLDRRESYTNPNGLTEHYEHDAANTMTVRTDINGNKWQHIPDAAKRIQKDIAPETQIVTVTEQANGKLTSDYTANMSKRTVETHHVYDEVNNVKREIRDAGQGDERHLTAAYTPANQCNEMTLENIEVDDSKVNVLKTPNTMPTKKENIKKVIIRDAQKNILVEQKRNGQFFFYVYDAALNKRFIVNANGAITELTPDEFGGEVERIKYRNKMTLKPAYYTSGIPYEDVLQAIVIDKDNDRQRNLVRNKVGDIATVIKPETDNFNPSTKQYASTRAKVAYINNSFGKRKSITKERFHDDNSLDSAIYHWYNKDNKLLAKAERIQSKIVNGTLKNTPIEYRVTRYEIGPFGHTVKETKFATSIKQSIDESTTLATLDSLCISSIDDRIKEITYDTSYNKKTENKLNRLRQEQTMNKGLPSMNDIRVDIETEWKTIHSKDGHREVQTIRYFKANTQQKLKEYSLYTYYNARGYKVAFTGAPRTVNINGSNVICRRLLSNARMHTDKP